jgi:hypothetical protein
VAQKLDVSGGIKSYNERRGEILLDEVLGDADAGDDGYVTISELLSDEKIKNPVCPVCGGALTEKLKPLHSKGQRYTTLYNCRRDGDIFISLKLHRNLNDTWRARRTAHVANEEKIALFKDGLDRALVVKRKAKRRRQRKPTAKAPKGAQEQ